MTARRVIVEAHTRWAATVAPQEIGGYPTFVEKDILPDVPQRLPGSPLAARRGDIRPTLFVGVYRFF
jgi:hypothetical protein